MKDTTAILSLSGPSLLRDVSLRARSSSQGQNLLGITLIDAADQAGRLGIPVKTLFSVLKSPPSTVERFQIELGASLETVDKVVAEALVASLELPLSSEALCANATSDGGCPTVVSDEAKGLGKWLASEVLGASVQEGNTPEVSEKELAYFVASGSYRAYALKKVLRRFMDSTTFRTMTDVGAGIGLISWLVAADPQFDVGVVTLVEPLARYDAATRRLWGLRAAATAVHQTRSKAEEYISAEAQDLFIFCHCLFRMVPEHRRGVMRNAWEALRPGGLLVVNEVVQRPSIGANSTPGVALTLPELLELFHDFREPDVFVRRDGWSTPHDTMAITAAELGSDSFFVVMKPLENGQNV